MARHAKISVIGSGFYGTTTAQRLAEYNIFDTVVLTDIIEGKPEGSEGYIGPTVVIINPTLAEE